MHGNPGNEICMNIWCKGNLQMKKANSRSQTEEYSALIGFIHFENSSHSSNLHNLYKPLLFCVSLPLINLLWLQECELRALHFCCHWYFGSYISINLNWQQKNHWNIYLYIEIGRQTIFRCWIHAFTLGQLRKKIESNILLLCKLYVKCKRS